MSAKALVSSSLLPMFVRGPSYFRRRVAETVMWHSSSPDSPNPAQMIEDWDTLSRPPDVFINGAAIPLILDGHDEPTTPGVRREAGG